MVDFKKIKNRLGLGIVLSCLVNTALIFHSVNAMENIEKKIRISDGYSNSIRPGQTTIAVYFDNVVNTSEKDIDIIKVTSPDAEKLEIHSMQVVNNLMKMRVEQKITIPAQSKISLGKGNSKGFHIMVQNISPNIKNGGTFSVIFLFSNGKTLPCDVFVKN